MISLKHYFLLYLILSIFIGLIKTFFEILIENNHLTEKQKSQKAQEEILDDAVEKGHIQKGTCGDRVVFHEDTLYGQTIIEGVNITNKLKEYSFPLYITLVFIVGVVDTTITWPKMLYNFLVKKS